MGAEVLLQPFSIAGMELRNRVVSTSHASGYADNGLPGERYQRYHEEKAIGGVALTMFGGSSIVSPEISPMYRQIDVSTDVVIPQLTAFAQRLHRHGTQLMCQISHMGRRTAWDDGDWIVPIAPSSVRDPAHHAVPRAMDVDDIERVIADYGAAARRCAEGGLDGVEVMVSSHLPGQFLAPEANRRSDEWGGSLDNRSRFLRRVMQAIRATTPSGFVVSLRMSADESSEGGPDAVECQTIAASLYDEGLYDLLNLNGIAASTTPGLAELIGGMARPLAPYLDAIATFRAAVPRPPLLHASRLADCETAAFAIESGAIDLAGMTRALFADPYLVRKLEAGAAGRIRPCVGAAYCIDRIYMGRDALCAHNPATGRETWLAQRIEPTSHARRRVIVIGGGPAGLEAARVAAERGHHVELHEATSNLGGQVLDAARAAWRHDLRGIVGWLAAEVEALGVTIHRNSPIDAVDVLAAHPDLVIVATGGSPRRPEIPGADAVASPSDILSRRVVPGSRVLVYDEEGRHSAPALAQHLAESNPMARPGERHHVVVVTPDRLLGRDLGGTSYPVYMRALAQAGVRVVTDHRLEAVEPGNGGFVARLRHVYGSTSEHVVVDTVVAELGSFPNDDVFGALQPVSANRGVTDPASLRAGSPQPWFGPASGWSRREETFEGYLLFRVGDVIASRDIHAALLDARRLLQDC